MNAELAPISAPVTAAVETVGSVLPGSLESMASPVMQNTVSVDLSALVPHELGTIHLDRALPDPRLAFNDKLFAPITKVETSSVNEPQGIGNINAAVEEVAKFEREADANLLMRSLNVVQELKLDDKVKIHIERAFRQVAEEKGLAKEESQNIQLEVTNEQEDEMAITSFPTLNANARQMEEGLNATKPDMVLVTQVSTGATGEVEADAQNDLKTLPMEQADSGQPPTFAPPALGMQELPEPLDAIKFEEPEYERVITEEEENLARDVQKSRLKVAEDMVQAASRHPETAKESLEADINKLDVPSLDEAREILAGKLKRPPVVPKAFIGLSFVENDDLTGAQEAIVGAINSVSPTRKERVARYEGNVALRSLETGAMQIALDGAKKIVLKAKSGWKAVNRLTRKDLIEYKRIDEGHLA